MKPKVTTGVARRLLVTVAVIAFAPVTFAQSSAQQAAAEQTFFVLNNTNDPMFNQLLGISDQQVIVGYFGDGMVVANNGYVLVPQNHYSVENFCFVPNCNTGNIPPPAGSTAAQTQAIGINSMRFPEIVGFYTAPPPTNFTHGFLDSNGIQSTIDDPAGSPPNVTNPVQNLLGINNDGKAAGFWTDNNGHTNGFVVDLNTLTFMEIPPATFGSTSVATQASDITDNNEVCGFWTDTTGNNHGFTVFIVNGNFQRFNPLVIRGIGVTAVSTSPFGCNGRGEVVGSFVDSMGKTHGFIFDTMDFHQYDAKGSSQTPAFGVAGTFINGINNQAAGGAIVGFFSDGENVNGFVDFAPVQ